MIRSLHKTSAGGIQTDLPPADYPAILQDPGSMLWVDIANEPEEEIRALFLNTFGFHPLAIEDALEETHIPKLDNWGSYLYLVLRAIKTTKPSDQDEDFETQEIDIFLGSNYIVTYHTHSFKSIEKIWERYLQDIKLYQQGPAEVIYNIIDATADDYMALAEEIAEEINSIEDQLFDDPKQIMLETIFTLKRDLLHLRRIIGPQREMVNKLARDNYEAVQPDEKIYFRDVYDHFVRLYDILENLRDLTGSALEIYLSVVNNRMNNVMKTLTIITTLFMPISFLAGFFGMNFFNPTDPQAVRIWTDLPTFQILLVAMISFPIGMFLWIRRRGWME